MEITQEDTWSRRHIYIPRRMVTNILMTLWSSVIKLNVVLAFRVLAIMLFEPLKFNNAAELCNGSELMLIKSLE